MTPSEFAELYAPHSSLMEMKPALFETANDCSAETSCDHVNWALTAGVWLAVFGWFSSRMSTEGEGAESPCRYVSRFCIFDVYVDNASLLPAWKSFTPSDTIAS